MKKINLILIVMMVWLVSCNTAPQLPTVAPTQEGVDTPAEIAAPTTAAVTATRAIPTKTPTLNAALILVGTDTPIPSATPLPTATPTAIPTATPLPTIPAETLIEVEGVTLPEGFSLLKFAEVDKPTNFTFDQDGNLYVTTQDGNIIVLADHDGDGRADFRSQFSYGFSIPLGVAVHPTTGDVYVSSTGKVSLLRDTDNDFVADEVTNVIDGLPNNLHKNNNLKFGRDGLLYMGVGSTCDVCYEVDDRSATLMRFNVETGEGEVFATGLRNSYDLAFHPETDALFATDNGRDDLGVEKPKEELNHIMQGHNYGWPDCWDVREGSGCDGTTTAISFFESRSSTNSLDFYTGEAFPAEYKNKLFAGVFGSWVRTNTERGIWMIDIVPSGDTFATRKEWFARWPDGWVLGLLTGPDGALYVGDYMNDSIYRISYGLPEE